MKTSLLTKTAAIALYEAEALGVAEFKRCGLMDTQPGSATRHELRMSKLESWLDGGATSPREQVKESVERSAEEMSRMNTIRPRLGRSSSLCDGLRGAKI